RSFAPTGLGSSYQFNPRLTPWATFCRHYVANSYRTFSSFRRSRADVGYMAVTVDHQPLAAESLGLRTVGQVLSHLTKGNRLVVQVLIDGQEPDLAHLGSVRRETIAGHELFIETAGAREVATDALLHVEEQLK